jgi:hypothetical protein
MAPLLQLAVEGGAPTKEEAMWAMTGVGHRIGRTALMEEVARVSSSEDETGRARDALADRILSFSAAAAQDYFALFYQSGGIEPPDLWPLRKTAH